MTMLRLTLSAALCLRAAAFLGAPPAPRVTPPAPRVARLRMSSTDTLYGASDARRTEEPAVAAGGAGPGARTL